MKSEICFSAGDRIARICAAYNEGATVHQISQEWDLDPKTVKVILRKGGINTKPEDRPVRRRRYRDIMDVKSVLHKRVGYAIFDLEMSMDPAPTMEQLSCILKMSPQTIKVAKEGRYDISLSKIQILAEALGVSVMDILGNDYDHIHI